MRTARDEAQHPRIGRARDALALGTLRRNPVICTSTKRRRKHTTATFLESVRRHLAADSRLPCWSVRLVAWHYYVHVACCSSRRGRTYDGGPASVAATTRRSGAERAQEAYEEALRMSTRQRHGSCAPPTIISRVMRCHVRECAAVDLSSPWLASNPAHPLATPASRPSSKSSGARPLGLSQRSRALTSTAIIGGA
jgi:hypothetical protein